MARLAPLAALALGVAPGAACAAPTAAIDDSPGRATVVRAVDGDTLDVRVGGARERVRLVGVDAPETHHPRIGVECQGPEAAARTAALAPPGATVVLARDAEPRDAYGRLLAYAWLDLDGAGAHETLLNALLVREGLATPLRIEPNVARAGEFADAARAAHAASRGLWGACDR
ncbi:MAG: thermonuclease family protein [Ilumatobacteraceae bacterium]